MLDELLSRSLGLSEITDVLAFHTNLPTKVKLALLEEVDATRRANLMLDVLPKPEVSESDGLPPFSVN